jgi:proteic killer suppression protein
MEITFSDQKLEELANNDRKRIRELGKIQADILRRRLTQLENSTTLEDVRHLPGRYHELTHNRKGQWGCDLDQPNRLIFKPLENPIPQNDNGQYIWSAIKGIEVIEIINYHKEN